MPHPHPPITHIPLPLLPEEKQARADSWREAVRNVFGLDPRAGRRAKPHMKTVDEKKIAVRKAMEEAARQDAEAAELEEKTLAEQEAAEAVTARLMSEDDSVSVEAKMEAIANAEKVRVCVVCVCVCVCSFFLSCILLSLSLSLSLSLVFIPLLYSLSYLFPLSSLALVLHKYRPRPSSQRSVQSVQMLRRATRS